MAIKAQSEAELSSMREMISNKYTEDKLVNAKNNEKNMVLFNETVRIGQVIERLESQIQQLGAIAESKLQSLEGRLLKAEQESGNIDNLRSMFTNTMVGLTERTEERFNRLEASLNIVTVVYKLIIE